MSRSSGSWPLGLLLWLAVVVVWLTWSPFVPRLEAAEIQWRFSANPVVVVGNLLLFAPVGAVMGLFGRGTPLRRALVAAGLIAVGSVVVEAGQWFIEGRNVSPYDVLLNASGAGLAAHLAARSVRPERVRLATAALGVLVFVPLFAYLALSARATKEAQRLHNWNVYYPVLVGDELGGRRPYQGTIIAAEICANGGGTSVCAGPGADDETRSRLIDAAERGQKLHITAEVISAADDQTGPTRIISFSGGTVVRNVTLGQQGRDVVLRIRSPLAGRNSSRGQFVLEDAIHADRPTRITATYDAGAVRLSVETNGQRRAGSYYPGVLQGWLLADEAFSVGAQHRIVEVVSRWAGKQVQDEMRLKSLRFYTLLTTLLLVFPVAWAVSWWRPYPQRVTSLAAGALGGLAFLLVVDLVLRSPTPQEPIMITLPVAVAGALLGTLDRQRQVAEPSSPSASRSTSWIDEGRWRKTRARATGVPER